MCVPTGFSEATGIGATLIALLDQRSEKLTWDFDPEHKGRRWFNEMYASWASRLFGTAPL